MKELVLLRDDWNDRRTLGTLLFGGHELDTIERPWIPSHPGGRPSESCVPSGLYQLVPHTRPSGDKVVALVNEGLAVYHYTDDRLNGIGRSLILIHAGNWVSDIIGCIAPGLGRAKSEKGDMVTSSRLAMHTLMEYIGSGHAQLEIRQHWLGESYGRAA